MEKERKIKLIFAAIMMISGLLVVAYPFVSNMIANRNASVAIDNVVEKVEKMDKEEIDALKEAANAYNEMLSQVENKNEQGEGVQLNGAVDIFQLGEAIGYISIPKIDIKLPIYEGTSDAVLARGIGHLSNTSYPVGGSSTHSALSGHRGMADAELFTNLDKVEVGDQFYLHILDEVLAYQVDQIIVVEPDDNTSIQIVNGEDLCTLVTCTPLGINSHRLLVRGTRVEYTGEEVESSDAVYKNIHTGTAARRMVVIWPWLALAAMIIIGIEFFIMITLLRRIRERREDD